MKINPRLIIVILVAICFGVALLLRAVLPYDQIFRGEWIKLSSVDGYYYMRLVDNLVHNFPNLTNFDPFFIYPGGTDIGTPNLFYWCLSGVIWIIGLGSPTQHTIDAVSVFFPPVLAALTVIPVYFIGRTLFNRWAGVIAAALFAVFPGESIGRSILGFGDTPVAEMFLTTTTLAFLMLAVKTAGQRQLTYRHLIRREWGEIGRPLIYSLLAGLFLGIYLATWMGGLLFVFIISLYLIIQYSINHLRGKSSDHLGMVSFILFLAANIVFLPFSPARDLSVAMLAALLIPVVLSGVSLVIANRGLKPGYYPLVLVGIGLVFIIFLRIIDPGTLNVLIIKFRTVFFPGGASAATTMEMQPFLSPQGSFHTGVAWGNFTTSFFVAPWWIIPGVCFAALCGLLYRFYKESSYDTPVLIFLSVCVVVMILAAVMYQSSMATLDVPPVPGLALISFVILIYLFIKRRRGEENLLLFLLWTLIILVTALVQRRFAYYFVINAALLSAYLSWQIIWLSGIRKLAARPEAAPEGAKAPKNQPKRRGLTIHHVSVSLAIIVLLLFVFFPNYVKAREAASHAYYAPSDAWQESLLWMKDNTPDPFGDPDAYYKLYEKGYRYPESAYGVAAWWDYGYWITRIAHRLPVANPSQPPEPIAKIAEIFLSEDEAATYAVMEKLAASYIIADYAISTTKFWAMATWAERSQEEFIDTYYLPYEGELMPVYLFQPEYYRTLLVRMYNFDGQATITENPTVISYDEKADRSGNRYKQIYDINEFSSHQEALDYVEKQGSPNHDIVGISPFTSPIPLEAVEKYRLIHISTSVVRHSETEMVPEVKIFEYLK
ncbi:oligosaccharyl transferase, archaeosortase A system-associated [Chloroflexota bacterium]